MNRTRHKLADIVDIDRLQRICDDYVEAGGMALAVLDPDGTVLVASGWQDICMQYHRRTGTTLAACLESDLRINERILAGLESPGHVAYKCANGLWDVAFPLVVDGEHLANLFTGQFFYDDDAVDIEGFRRRARELGFDERDYIDALERVPVVTYQRVEQTMRFLADLVGMLGELGLAAIRRDQDRESLRTSQAALEEAQTIARLGRWELDLVHDRLEWSSSIFDLLEVDQREFTASYEAFLAAIHPDDRAAVDGAYAKSLKDRRPYEIVHRLLMADGRVKWVHEQCRTEYAPDGTPLRSVGVVQDITAQRSTEEALRESREVLRAVLDAIPVRVFWKDSDLTYLGCNAPFARDAGFEDPEDLVGKDDYAMGWREQADLYRADDSLVIESGEPRLLVEEPQTTPAGEHIDLLTSKVPLRDASNDVIGVLGTYYDVTEHRRAERALHQNEELLRGLYDTMPSGAAIYEVRGDGSKGSDYIVKDFNATSLRLEGKAKEEVVGKSLFDLRPTIDEYGLIPVFQRVWQTGEPALFPSSLYVDEHYTNWYENRVFRLPSGEIVAIYDDVTERLQAEEELRRISWMLSSQHPTRSGGSTRAYGDLTRFNTRRVILDAIPREQLEDIASDYVGLLESSAAVYEANGDYALGIFASGWCRYLDAASRRLCPGDDEAALRSGLWLCHESCWGSASSLAIETRKPVDIACHGGLHLYAVPVLAGDDVVGSINIGYGDPPRDPDVLSALADEYQVDADELARLAAAYESRPPFVIDQAKRRLESSARLIGALVETQRSHEALHQSQRQYETFINATDDVAFLKDGELRHLIVNAALAAFFGRGIEEVVGRTDEELMPAAAAEACRASDLRALQHAGLVVTTEKQGDRVYESRKFPVALTDGCMGVGGYVRDVTEQRRAEGEIRRLAASLERQVEQRTEQLEATNRELESFAYSISHDLRAPLRALDGFSEILLQDYSGVLDEEGRGYLRRIKGAANHMAGLMDGLLRLSRLNREELELENVDLSALASSFVAELRERDPARDVVVDIAPGLVARADPKLMRVVVENLLGNAWKFTSRQETARIVVGAAQTDHGRAFFVRDDGAGFDMRYAKNLFGAFQRLHTPDQFEGTGIGLATVQRIVIRHGGTVWAEGEVDKGATFWFTLGAPGAC